MPAKSKGADGYLRFSASLKAGKISSFYIFHGEESYLLVNCIGDLRRLLCPNGLDSFNYKRMDGKNFSVAGVKDAIETLPAFAEKTLIEVHDFDIFKIDGKEEFINVLSDLPDYVCIVIIYDTIPYKPDGRVKLNSEILKFADVVEFSVQNQDKLIKWIEKHFADAGKKISTEDAQHLAFITGGYMSSLNGEIEKVAAFALSETVTRADIDAVVSPVLETVAYNLTDALARHDYTTSMKLLDDLLLMREAPHKILFSISLKMRQILAARVCIDSVLDKTALMEMAGIRKEYPALLLFETARKMTLEDCCNAVLYCSRTALDLNSSSEPEARLVELVAKLAYDRKRTKQ